MNTTLTAGDFAQFCAIVKNPDKRFIVVDGLIGAGKTTLIKLVSNHCKDKKIHPIYEPVDIWRRTGALGEFYKDIPAKCYEFQSFVYVTRIKRVILDVLANPDADIYILERSIFTDRYIFVEMLRDTLGAIRYDMYNEWWDMWNLLMPIKFDKWVFLDVSLDESMRRIHNRSRGEESGIDPEYQRNLRVKHIEFYESLKKQNYNVCTITSELMDNNFIDNYDVLDEICNKIMAI